MARVLVACEFTGTVRDAFRAAGHDAWSSDILPCEKPGPHLQGNVLNYLDRGWDLMIADPPCRDLAVSGARHFKGKALSQSVSLDFINELLAAPIKRICVSAPVSVLSTDLRKCDQVIQPYEFGHSASMRLCLWLKGLPHLVRTKIVLPWTYGCPRCRIRYTIPRGPYGCPKCKGKVKGKLIHRNQTPSGRNILGPSEFRGRDRSRAYYGVASAMADQWGRLLD